MLNSRQVHDLGLSLLRLREVSWVVKQIKNHIILNIFVSNVKEPQFVKRNRHKSSLSHNLVYFLRILNTDK